MENIIIIIWRWKREVQQTKLEILGSEARWLASHPYSTLSCGLNEFLFFLCKKTYIQLLKLIQYTREKGLKSKILIWALL